MERKNFWNDAAKYGAILGGLLALSAIVETYLQLSGNWSMLMLMIFEFIGVAALHYYLLHRFTRSYSRTFSMEEGFTFGQGYGYLLIVSAFAGVLVGVVQYVNINLVIGFSTYTEKVASSMSSMIAHMSPSMQGMYVQMIDQMQNAAEPSIISTVWSGLFSGLLFGAIFGLIIAGVLSRSPKPFADSNNE